MNVAVIIAARMKSSRFPGKPLVDLGGMPMIRRTFENAQKAGYDTFVLSDHQEILDLIPKNNGIMTDENCRDGTHRCMTVIGQKIKYDSYVYVQGDFPDIDVETIHETVKHMNENDTFLSHAYTNFIDEKDRRVKGRINIIHSDGVLRWTTRALLNYGDKLVGVYGFRDEAAKYYKNCKVYPAYLAEKIDTLVWLENGVRMTTYKVPFDGIDINYPEDVEEWYKIHGLFNK